MRDRDISWSLPYSKNPWLTLYLSSHILITPFLLSSPKSFCFPTLQKSLPIIYIPSLYYRYVMAQRMLPKPHKSINKYAKNWSAATPLPVRSKEYEQHNTNLPNADETKGSSSPLLLTPSPPSRPPYSPQAHKLSLEKNNFNLLIRAHIWLDLML